MEVLREEEKAVVGTLTNGFLVWLGLSFDDEAIRQQ